jgi:hypothetical protein
LIIVRPELKWSVVRIEVWIPGSELDTKIISKKWSVLSVAGGAYGGIKPTTPDILWETPGLAAEKDTLGQAPMKKES